MKNAVKLILLCVLTMSAVAGAAEDAPKLVGEKEIMKLDASIFYGKNDSVGSMCLSPDGRRVLYLRKMTCKTTAPDGKQQDSEGCKLVLRDLNTGKDTVVPVPAIDDLSAVSWISSSTMFDPEGKTLVVPVGLDGNKNDLMEMTERCKAGLYNIASGKITDLDVEGDMVLPTFSLDGKTLVVMTAQRFGVIVKFHVTPTDKIKFRTSVKGGLVGILSPTSDLIATILLCEGGMPPTGKCVLYDLKTDTVKAELAGREAQYTLMKHLPKWTGDGRYVYHLKDENGRRYSRTDKTTLMRIWDVQAGKEAGVLTDAIPVGRGPGKDTMVLVRLPNSGAPVRAKASTPQAASDLRPQIVLHAWDEKTRNPVLHPLGDKSMRPIGTQGKWLLFIRKDAKGNETACMAEIVLPKTPLSELRGPKPSVSFPEAIGDGNVREVHAILKWPTSIFCRIDAPLSKIGPTPLHRAASHGHLELVKYLVANGAEINSFGHWSCGCTPLQLAERNKHTAVAAFLKANGAKDYPLRNSSYIKQLDALEKYKLEREKREKEREKEEEDKKERKKKKREKKKGEKKRDRKRGRKKADPQ